MAIIVRWHNPEQTIILQKREPGRTWEDFDGAVDQYGALARSVEQAVVLINAPSPSPLNH